MRDKATGPLDPNAVLQWMQAHPERLRQLLADEDADGSDDAAASDSAVRAHQRLAAEGLVHGAAAWLAQALDGMADELDEWFTHDRELFEHQIALGEGAIALEEHLLYQGDASTNPDIHDALERRVRLGTWNLLFLRCIESRLGPEHDGFASEALQWTATRGRDLAGAIMQIDRAQQDSLAQRLGRRPTLEEREQSGQAAAVAAYTRLVILATAHTLDPARADRAA